MSDQFFGFGILGALSVSHDILEWTVLLGWKLSIFHTESNSTTSRGNINSICETRRRNALEGLNDSFIFAGMSKSPKQMYQDCDMCDLDFHIQIDAELLKYHGTSAYALTNLANFAVQAQFLLIYKEVVTQKVRDITRAFQHYCPNLGIDINRFVLLLEEEDPWDNLLQSSEVVILGFFNRLLVPLTILLLPVEGKVHKRCVLEAFQARQSTWIRRDSVRNAIQLKECADDDIHEVKSALNLHRPAIIQFCGQGPHATSILRERFGIQKQGKASALLDVLAEQTQLELVLLYGCVSDDLAKAIANVVGHVIGVHADMVSMESIEFTMELFQALGCGLPIDKAFHRAMAARLFSCSSVKIDLVMKSP